MEFFPSINAEYKKASSLGKICKHVFISHSNVKMRERC